MLNELTQNRKELKQKKNQKNGGEKKKNLPRNIARRSLDIRNNDQETRTRSVDNFTTRQKRLAGIS